MILNIHICDDIIFSGQINWKKWDNTYTYKNENDSNAHSSYVEIETNQILHSI